MEQKIMDLSVKLEIFEGPLDLLLHLLDKNKVSIYDIPIVEITDQYLAYIREMQRQDLNLMSEFMIMAATLLDIKARWLLPRDETVEDEEGDPREALMEQLLLYKTYKYLAQGLRERREEAGMQMYRSQQLPQEVQAYEEPIDLDKLTEGLDLSRLHEIFAGVMRRQERKIDPIRSRFGQIEKEEISVEDRISYLQKHLSRHKSCSFRELLERQNSRMELVVTFLAVLELMKTGEIVAIQEETFGEILLESGRAKGEADEN